MPKYTENFGMTFAKKWTNREPQICRNGNESTFRQNIGHSASFPGNNKGHLGTIETCSNTIEEFAYILTTSNLHVLAFDTSRKSTQISCSLKLNSKTKYRLYLVNY